MQLFSYRFLYVFFVLVLDTLVYLYPHFLGIQWTIFNGLFQEWQNSPYFMAQLFSSFDFFKFTFWLLLPVLWITLDATLLRKKPKSTLFFSVKLRKNEWFIYFIFLFIGFLFISLISYFPQLRVYYPSQNHLPFQEKILLMSNYLLWTFSWLLGWEFLFRYYLLSAIPPKNQKIPFFSLSLIPFLETFYHVLQRKDPLECGLTLFFSICATLWCFRKNNIFLPFLIHFSIEVCLILYLVTF